jgi:hypothetical protein
MTDVRPAAASAAAGNLFLSAPGAYFRYLFGRNPKPCQKIRMPIRVARFKHTVPFHHSVIIQSDLPEHVDPRFLVHFSLHCQSPLKMVLVFATAMTTPV